MQLSLFDVTVTAEDILKKKISSIYDFHEKVEYINKIKLLLHELSPFRTEPVDCVIWVQSDSVYANDYNPNSVAPPEMELLRHSINHDGYTQPVVTCPRDGDREVVDGFHRTRVCKEFDDVKNRVNGYLPVVSIKTENTGKKDRMASTIRHNRARGKHNVDAMSEIVIELKRRNWTNKRICKELGMDQDEVLRLCQMTGLQEMFSDDDFSKSWDIDIMSEVDIEAIMSEENIEPDKEMKDGRIVHTFDKWECHKAGFYSTSTPDGLTKEDCEERYGLFLSNVERFEDTLKKVITEWKYSCEHYLSNDTMNRIAWLGQAAACYELGIPSCFRSGYNLLSDEQKLNADKVALKYLNIWLESNGFEKLSEDAINNQPKSDIY